MSSPTLVDFRRYVPAQPLSEAEAHAAQHPPETLAEGIARRRTTLSELRLPIPAEDVERVVTYTDLRPLEALQAVRAWMVRIDALAEDERNRMRAAQSGVHLPALATRPRPVLALLGDLGRGKTVAAAWLLAERPGAYVKLDAAGPLKASRAAEDRALWRRLKATPYLVLDEVGHELDPVLGKAALNELVDERQGEGRWTLLIGNIDEAHLRRRYDPRTIDRLGRMWRVQVCAGPSLRRT